MYVTALCVGLLMDVLVLLVAGYFAQEADAAFPRISPDRLQFFEYETVTVNCEELGGLTEWRVMKKLNKTNSTSSNNWNSSAASCNIDPAFDRHSGEYWCEDVEGKTSHAVNIAVTAGSVILEVPARPVVEGYDVILHCRNKKAPLGHIADFYKDGFRIGTQYEGNMTIQHVSKSDVGFYKCRISGAGESPESWLAVFKLRQDDYEETPSTDHISKLWVVVFVPLLLLMMGLLVSRTSREPDVSRADTKPRLPDKRVYSLVYYRPLTRD